jgi:hypothetical protein
MALLRFTAVLKRPEGVGTWTFAPVPREVSERLGVRGQVRVAGKVDGQAFRSTLLPDGAGGHFLVVKAEWRKAIGKEAGARVEVQLARDAAKPQVEVPAELKAALAKDPAAKAAFDRMPPSHRKEHTGFVAEAKKPETRERRAAATVKALKERAA